MTKRTTTETKKRPAAKRTPAAKPKRTAKAPARPKTQRASPPGAKANDNTPAPTTTSPAAFGAPTPSDHVSPKSKSKAKSKSSSTPQSAPVETSVNASASAIRLNKDLLLTALPHPIFVLDAQFRFAYVSASAETFFETSTAMLKRLSFADVVHDTSPLYALIHQVRDTSATVNEYAIDITTKRFDGPKLVDVFAGPIPEQPELTVVMLLQRTMAQMIERQLTHRAAARSVSGMASILAHEIKNPLSGIRGAAQLLEHNLSDDDRILSQLICSETDRINKLVDRMEVFGDLRPINKTPVNIHDVLAHVRNIAMAGFASHIPISEEYDPSLPPVPGDRDRLVQAFLNLIKNAAEALPGDNSNDRVVIRTAFRPGVRLMVPGATARVSLPLMIQIEDNGNGIPDDLKPHLFDPFVTTKTSGTGLGLALVAKIIDDHGGIVECESESNRTVFRVLLPLQSTPHKPVGPVSASMSTAHHGTRNRN